MTIPPEIIVNGCLAIVLAAFWNNHIVRYKWKLVRKIAALDFKIDKSAKSETSRDTKFYVTQRIMLHNELWELQRLTDYSGFR